MSDVDRVKQLESRRQKAEIAHAKLSGQRESLATKIEELETNLLKDHGLTFDEVEAKLEKLKAEQEEKLSEAAKLLDSLEA